ncbi:hypothetical protein DSUL_50123 [Desulfovibrionales bacterium]
MKNTISFKIELNPPLRLFFSLGLNRFPLIHSAGIVPTSTKKRA